MSHIWMSHVTHMNESRHTYEWVTSHIWMSHVTHMTRKCMHQNAWFIHPQPLALRMSWDYILQKRPMISNHRSLLQNVLWHPTPCIMTPYTILLHWECHETTFCKRDLWFLILRSLLIVGTHSTLEYHSNIIRKGNIHMTRKCTSHIWMSRGTHMNESCHTYEWVMSHIWMSHVTHMNESCHTYDTEMHASECMAYACTAYCIGNVMQSQHQNIFITEHIYYRTHSS